MPLQLACGLPNSSTPIVDFDISFWNLDRWLWLSAGLRPWLRHPYTPTPRSLFLRHFYPAIHICQSKWSDGSRSFLPTSHLWHFLVFLWFQVSSRVQVFSCFASQLPPELTLCILIHCHSWISLGSFEWIHWSNSDPTYSPSSLCYARSSPAYIYYVELH